MGTLRKTLQVTGWCLSIAGGLVFVLGVLLVLRDIRHHMKWKEVEASIVCIGEPASPFKDCQLEYAANGSQLSRPFFRSKSAAEGLVGKQRIYYWQNTPEKITFSRGCGLPLLAAEITAFLGMIVFLAGIGAVAWAAPPSRH